MKALLYACAIILTLIFVLDTCTRMGRIEQRVERNEIHMRCQFGIYGKEFCDNWRDELRNAAGLPPVIGDR